MRRIRGSSSPAQLNPAHTGVVSLDETDGRILSILERNARTANKEIAKQLSVSEGTIRNRIKRLTETGFLKAKGLTNASLRLDKQVVYILVKVPLQKGWDDTARRISELSDVKSVSLLTGRFDLLVEVFIEPHRLIQFINDKLGALETIDSSESLIAVKHYNKWV